MGTYRIHLNANRSAVRASGAAHKCLGLGGRWFEMSPRGTEGQQLPPTVEPPG